MRYRLRTLLLIAALVPALLARHPVAILTAAVFAVCLFAAVVVEATDWIKR